MHYCTLSRIECSIESRVSLQGSIESRVSLRGRYSLVLPSLHDDKALLVYKFYADCTVLHTLLSADDLGSGVAKTQSPYR